MKKLLIRAGMSPLEEFNPSKIIVQNCIGNNVGNLIYQFGIFRALTLEDTEIIPDYYGLEKGRMTPDSAKTINKNYDAYICPLADAFRPNFVEKLNLYTELIKKLKIPFIVAGVGIKTSLKNEENIDHSFNEDVYDFIKSVLETGSIIGVRGEKTADYLTNLGFKENKEFMIIGCPSMFTFGKHLKIYDKKITNDSPISINSSLLTQKNVLKFIVKASKEFPNNYFIPQWLSELSLTYIGYPRLNKKTKLYPTNMESEEYKNNKVRFPISAAGWIDFLKGVDLSFGARLHGNIAATLAGTPNIITVKDGRMKEVVDYHELTHVTPRQLKKYNSLRELIDNLDFHSCEYSHEKRFKNYLTFWSKNNVKTIYDDDFDRKDAPLDEKLKFLSYRPPIETISNLNEEDISKRYKEYKKRKKRWEMIKWIIRYRTNIYYIKSQPTFSNKVLAFFKTLNKITASKKEIE